ncbi:MAG: hypothetical protein WCK32_07205 [Chlorobiaceae bacterium]
MIDNQEELREIVYMVTEILKEEKLEELTELLNNSLVTIDQTGYDNWNGGTYLYTLYLTVDIGTFVKIRDRVQSIESELLEKFRIATRHNENESISNITIVPKAKLNIDWGRLAGISTKEHLIKDVNFLKNSMISVSTGGPRIQDINDEYKKKFILTDKALQKLNFKNPNTYKDLWEWYGKWSSSFSKYNERRTYINEMYNSLIQMLEETEKPELISVTIDLTDWERIERSINEIRLRQNEAKTEEQFQVVGLLSRETIMTLAQAVYNKEKHSTLNEKEISKTDTKKMLEAYIVSELSGSSNETLRRYAKATLDLANELTHKRTATKKDASLCATATISIINLIGALEGRI